MNILDFDVAGRLVVTFEKQVDPGVFAISDFPAQGCVSVKFGNPAGIDGLGSDGIGVRGVDADHVRTNADQFPGEWELPLGIARRRHPDFGIGGDKTGHGAGIGTMGCDLTRPAVGVLKDNIREKSLIGAAPVAPRMRGSGNSIGPDPSFARCVVQPVGVSAWFWTVPFAA